MSEKSKITFLSESNVEKIMRGIKKDINPQKPIEVFFKAYKEGNVFQALSVLKLDLNSFVDVFFEYPNGETIPFLNRIILEIPLKSKSKEKNDLRQNRIAIVNEILRYKEIDAEDIYRSSNPSSYLENTTPLYLACKRNIPEIMDALLKREYVNVEHQVVSIEYSSGDVTITTPFSAAVEAAIKYGELDVLEKLLDCKKLDKNSLATNKPTEMSCTQFLKKNLDEITKESKQVAPTKPEEQQKPAPMALSQPKEPKKPLFPFLKSKKYAIAYSRYMVQNDEYNKQLEEFEKQQSLYDAYVFKKEHFDEDYEIFNQHQEITQRTLSKIDNLLNENNTRNK